VSYFEWAYSLHLPTHFGRVSKENIENYLFVSPSKKKKMNTRPSVHNKYDPLFMMKFMETGLDADHVKPAGVKTAPHTPGRIFKNLSEVYTTSEAGIS
jgi:hypothetical protein